jgi:hypothetical protein
MKQPISVSNVNTYGGLQAQQNGGQSPMGNQPRFGGQSQYGGGSQLGGQSQYGGQTPAGNQQQNNMYQSGYTNR